jgi:uncharacterized OsmC-like protein
MSQSLAFPVLFLLAMFLIASEQDADRSRAATQLSTTAAALKANLTNRIQQLQATQGPSLSTNTATARMVNEQLNEGKVRNFTLMQDEPASVAGTGKGPTPTDYFVQSIAFCENVLFVRNAALNDVPLAALETNVNGEWDSKGLFDIDGASSTFRTIVVVIRVKTTAPIATVVDVANLTHRRCPIHATLAKATNLQFRLFVNDVEAHL